MSFDDNFTAPANEVRADKQVAIINNAIEIFRGAPGVLKTNQERTWKAVDVGKSILNQWDAAWLIEDQDKMLQGLVAADIRSNKFLVNCSTALTQEMELRASITQMMDAFKNMFFEAEKEIDRARTGNVPNKIQVNRDLYAKKAKEIADEKRRVAELKEAKGKEAVELKAEAEKRLFNNYNEYLHGVKAKLQTAFNGLSLETFEAVSTTIKGYTPALKKEMIIAFKLDIFGKYHTREEIDKFIIELIDQKFIEFSGNYNAELSLLRDELVEKLPSKKTELLDAKRLADEAEINRKKLLEEKNAHAKKELEDKQKHLEEQKKKQEDETRKREADDKQRIDAEAMEAAKKNDEKVDLEVQGAQTMVMFDKHAELAGTGPKQETRTGYEITVLHPVGYTQIFQLYFEKVGKDLPLDKLGNTKLDGMKTWCENEAKKSGTMIEGRFLRYDETVKAVARREKATV